MEGRRGRREGEGGEERGGSERGAREVGGRVGGRVEERRREGYTEENHGAAAWETLHFVTA